MELREYWQIIHRRWWIPLVLTGLVALFSAWQLKPWQDPPATYSATMRMLIGVMPLNDGDSTAYDPRHLAWLISEYLVDDFTEVVRSDLFAQNVNTRLVDQAITIPAGLIVGGATTGKQHRILTITFDWGDRAQLEAIAAAATDELLENAGVYFHQLGTEGATATILDTPQITKGEPELRNRIEFPLRVLLALFIGVGLVFLLDYLDTSVHNRQELESMGIPVIGEIPR